MVSDGGKTMVDSPVLVGPATNGGDKLVVKEPL